MNLIIERMTSRNHWKPGDPVYTGKNAHPQSTPPVLAWILAAIFITAAILLKEPIFAWFSGLTRTQW